MRVNDPMPAMQNIDDGVKIERIVGRTDSGKNATAPGLPYVSMIDPAGNVVNLPVRSTRNLREAAKAGVDTIAYEAFILRKKRRKGWLIYDEVPAEQREGIISARKAYAQAQAEPYRRAWERQNEQAALQSKAAMHEAISDFMHEVKRMQATGTLPAQPVQPAAPKKNG